MASVAASRDCRDLGQPTWEIARLFPNQGNWSIEEYLALPGNCLIEFEGGNVEVLSMPTEMHQRIVAYLYRVIFAYVDVRKLGEVLFAPLKVRLSPTEVREPDVTFMRRENAARRHNECWDGADWVIEILSDDDPKRDLEIKRASYARAGIPEYWIVDPRKETVTVLRIEGDKYAEVGTFGAGEHAPSSVVAGFTLDVGAIFAAARS
jgi:Uma2 family endonuclease